MIIDMRYHIASLVAVFLALGLGILIGSTMLGDGLLVAQQKLLIDRLETDFEKIRTEERDLQAQVAVLEDRVAVDDRFARTVLPVLIKDRLYGKQIALVRTGDAADHRLLKELTGVLRDAGANVVSTTYFTQDLETLDQDRRQILAQSLGLAGAANNLPNELARGLAASIGRGVASPVMAYLRQHEIIQTSGDFQAPVDAVIVVGGGLDEKKQGWRSVDLPLIENLQKMGVSVIGVEPEAAKNSYIRPYKQKGLSTVDNIDMVPGQMALIYTLSAGKRGNFGVKDTARQLMPSPAEGFSY
ncbi:MAG: copper transporter [Firmicutes bacterium]|nr:copper transporter [Bacillota bacterium]